MAAEMNLENAVQDSTESGWYPLTSFAFMLRVELAFDLPCRAIKGLRRENEFDYIQEGGLNDYVHMKRKPISRPFTFQVERYVGLDYLDPLPLGVELTLPVLLFVNPYPFRNSSFFKPVRSYAFLGCTVTAKDYGELNAESSGLLVETTTIAFREMACIDLPSKWLNKNSWNFALDKDGKIDYEGQGESNKNTRDANLSAASQRSKKEMEEKAAEQLWAFDKKAKAGNDKRHYLNNAAKTNTSDTELTADKMNAKAKLWAFEKKTKEGNKERSYLHRENGTNTKNVEKTKDQMQAQAKQWPKTGSAVKQEMKTPEATLWAFAKDKKVKAGNDKRSYLHREKGTNTPGVEATQEQMQKKAQQWAFGKDKKVKAGNGTRNYLHQDKGTNTPEAEATKEQMNAKAQQWAFGEDKKVKAGNGKRNYLHRDNGTNTPNAEATQEQMNKKAQQWAFDKDKKVKAGNGKRNYLHRDNGTNTPDVEKTREQMQKKASIWPPKESAKKDEMKTPQARTGGAVKNEMKTPEARLWPKEASALQPPSSKAESRKWPDETSAQKAHTSKRKKTASSSSARKSSSSKAKSRVWPKTSSAQTAQTANIKGAGRTSSGGPGRKTSSSPRAGGR